MKLIEGNDRTESGAYSIRTVIRIVLILLSSTFFYSHLLYYIITMNTSKITIFSINFFLKQNTSFQSMIRFQTFNQFMEIYIYELMPAIFTTTSVQLRENTSFPLAQLLFSAAVEIPQLFAQFSNNNGKSPTVLKWRQECRSYPWPRFGCTQN